MARSEIGRTGARFGAPAARGARGPEDTPDPAAAADPGPARVGTSPDRSSAGGPPPGHVSSGGPAPGDASSGGAAPGDASSGGPAPGDAWSAGAAPEGDLVGVTGARFGGHSARRTRKSRTRRAAEKAQGSVEKTQGSAENRQGSAENTQRSAESSRRAAANRQRTTEDAQQAAETTRRTAGKRPAPDERQDGPAPDARGDDAGDTETAPLPVIVDDPAPEAASTPVRPYVLTGGRTRARLELRLETLVSVRPTPAPAPVGSTEKAAVLDLCARTRSVSEVAALAAVPLGVARVLIDDLAAEGRLTVHGDADDAPSLELLDRVLSGLRRL